MGRAIADGASVVTCSRFDAGPPIMLPPPDSVDLLPSAWTRKWKRAENRKQEKAEKAETRRGKKRPHAVEEK